MQLNYELQCDQTRVPPQYNNEQIIARVTIEQNNILSNESSCSILNFGISGILTINTTTTIKANNPAIKTLTCLNKRVAKTNETIKNISAVILP